MGFGFNLFGFPLLLLVTVGLTIYSIVRRSWRPMIFLVILWGLTVMLFIIAGISNYYRTPIRLTRQDIIGEYRIDTNFFTGTNANWQFEHFRFFIKDSDSIEFIVHTDNKTISKTYKHKVTFTGGTPTLWRISADTTHHVIQHQPTLYRGHKKFYYVFRSDKFGNMFFRKVER